MKNILMTCLAVILMSGCAVNNTLTYDAVTPKEGEVIVVFGMKPSNTKILFHEAVVDNGFTRARNIFERATGGNPLNGYVPVIVKPDSIYKLSSIILSVGDKMGGVYIACDGAKTISFKASPGSVTYIADIEFRTVNGSFSTGYRKNFTAAKKHIDENYPNLRGKIIEGTFEMVTPTDKCTDQNSAPSVIIVPTKKR